MIRIGFWGPLYYTYDKELPRQYWYLCRPLQHNTERVPVFRGFGGDPKP